ncbi:hypothetical protein LAZ67_15000739 [Cordylochernes scorpioides]|uniref:Transposable element Tc1 transposase n=1 Tax=Cordylochernes scorpioides TaxID=51811 RepID=A0ABY6L9D3_9ARAC|nr:hypothetical protein LAZ67_15000739 [Cordylochernes scorpioides]
MYPASPGFTRAMLAKVGQQRKYATSERQRSTKGNNRTGGQSNCQNGCRSTGIHVIYNPSVQSNHQQATVRAESKRSPTVTMPTPHTRAPTRTIAQNIQSQSGLSARRPVLRLPLTQNHRRLRRQWCDERKMWKAEWNEIVFIDESRFCLQHHDGRIRVWRHRGERMLNSCGIYRHTCPASDIMVWGGIGYHSRTSLVHIAGTLNSQRYISEVFGAS